MKQRKGTRPADSSGRQKARVAQTFFHGAPFGSDKMAGAQGRAPLGASGSLWTWLPTTV